MKRLLQKWHWFHTWTAWTELPPVYRAWVWLKPGEYSSIERSQQRTCIVCGKIVTKEI